MRLDRGTPFEDFEELSAELNQILSEAEAAEFLALASLRELCSGLVDEDTDDAIRFFVKQTRAYELDEDAAAETAKKEIFNASAKDLLAFLRACF